jgi:two-component system phosphate regulon response regulator PhoB
MLPAQKTVIIVDDEPETAEMIAEMVRLSGYQAIKSLGGSPAISMIVRQEPDAVLLDMMMPDISGLEVLRLMRLDPRMRHIPVIVVSAKNRPEDVRAGMDAGAAMYLTKPVAFKDIKAAVQQVVS